MQPRKEMTAGKLADLIVQAGVDPACDFAVTAALVEAGVKPDQVCRSVFPLARSLAATRAEQARKREARAA